MLLNNSFHPPAKKYKIICKQIYIIDYRLNSNFVAFNYTTSVYETHSILVLKHIFKNHLISISIIEFDLVVFRRRFFPYRFGHAYLIETAVII